MLAKFLQKMIRAKANFTDTTLFFGQISGIIFVKFSKNILYFPFFLKKRVGTPTRNVVGPFGGVLAASTSRHRAAAAASAATATAPAWHDEQALQRSGRRRCPFEENGDSAAASAVAPLVNRISRKLRHSEGHN